MKPKSRLFLLSALMLVPFVAGAATPVPQTAGSNLTAYNPTSGSINNNNWNNLVNARTAGASATADFGNCNALIMRCAQPKCGSGGCTDLAVTSSIVSGCVKSNAACSQYGDDLINYISAQLVATSTAKANEAANAAQLAAAQAAASDNAAQLQQMQQSMQMQMQQMQQQMAEQNQQTVAQLQSALEEQKQLTAAAQAAAAQQATQQAAAAAAATSGGMELTDAQRTAAAAGVSEDILLRETISGQILTSIENAEKNLKSLKDILTDLFSYAGCDSSGNNCAGPARVRTFKDKATKFFGPYNDVLSDLYEALTVAQTVGVDLSDVYMLINGGCNSWAQYWCNPGQVMTYNASNCINGVSRPSATYGQGAPYGNARCTVGQVVPESDNGCRIIKLYTSGQTDRVQRDMLYPEEGDENAGHIRVACASDALDNSRLFKSVKKQADIDIETLERIIAQDELAYNSKRNSSRSEVTKYCALNDKTYAELQRYVTTKTLPTRNMCINERKLNNDFGNSILLASTASEGLYDQIKSDCEKMNGAWSNVLKKCLCDDSHGAPKDINEATANANNTDKCNHLKSYEAMVEAEESRCRYYGGTLKRVTKCFNTSGWMDVVPLDSNCAKDCGNNCAKASCRDCGREDVRTFSCDCSAAEFAEDARACLMEFEGDKYGASEIEKWARAGAKDKEDYDKMVEKCTNIKNATWDSRSDACMCNGRQIDPAYDTTCSIAFSVEGAKAKIHELTFEKQIKELQNSIKELSNSD